jgi:lipopolysaccharide export system protein LptA
MPLDPKILRRLFATGAVLAILVAAFFYLRGIVKTRHIIEKLPDNIPANIERSGQGFTFSQSQGGKTLFTIHAANFQQFKDGGSAELHDVSITVYGQDENRSDYIYGSSFRYDQKSGDITADGEVHIDLDANSIPSSSAPGGSAPSAQESRTLIHVKTSGLTFNRNTGIAETQEKIEFRVPGANGSAVGANYDSHTNVLLLKSNVRLVSTEKQKATIQGQSASITKDPRRIVLDHARVEQRPRTITAEKLTVLLRDDNTVERILGSGNVRAVEEGSKPVEISAPSGEVFMAGANQPKSATLSGGVNFESRGDSPSQGKAERVDLSFASKGQISKARLSGGVELNQGPPAKTQSLKASTLDLFLVGGKRLDHAVTSDGPAQIVLAQSAPQKSITTISAAQLNAKFSAQNRLSSVYGSPDARIVSSTAGQPDRTARGQELTAQFNSRGEIASADLNGDFRYQQAQQTATAEHAHYNPADETFLLTGSPRLTDSGMSVTADRVELNRRTGAARADGNVKTTYNDLKPQPGGAMLAGGEPIHVTGNSATANRGTGVAQYSQARLWQGANIVEAPTLTFDKTRRSLQAQANQTGRVTSVFVMPQRNGKISPVNVTSNQLNYIDSERKAVFKGNVILRGDDFTMDADTVHVLLANRGAGGTNSSGNQLDRIVAQGDIQIKQGDRKALGKQLTYYASEEKFVLTGAPGQQPSIFDAEHGQISGDSLTFYTHDGRVLVGSGETPHILTPSRTAEAK